MIKIDIEGLDALIQLLRQQGYTVVGPTVRDHAIVYAGIDGTQDLPAGWTDEQTAGKYRLLRRNDKAVFGHVVGPQSWKQFLFPATLQLFSAKRTNKGFEISNGTEGKMSMNAELPRYAFIGVRSCELHAIGIQDKVFSEGEFTDPHYKSLRERVLLIAVNCGQAGGTCFCVSMNTGPRVQNGHDIVLTEVLNELGHFFIADAGTERGREILQSIPHEEATTIETEAAEHLVDLATQEMGRMLEADGVRELLRSTLEHPHWDEVARRCLTCANCTMVCPTCFCSTFEDVTDLSGQKAERWRRWDSCFTMDFSYIHGGSIRPTTRSRYRQWLTHKLGNWVDQFGVSGCVGCGRCITWCPVGIDITEEVRTLRKSRAEKPNVISV